MGLRSSWLGYPGAGVGVDLQHPAIAGSPAWISAACLGSANMVSLGSGQPGTIVSGPFAVAMNGGIGPSITKSASGSTYTKFTDPAGANTNQYFTAAFIYQLSSLSLINGLGVNNTAVSGWRVIVNTTGNVQLITGSTTVISGTASTVLAGIPYASIVCNSPSGAFIYTINLNTGKIVLSTASAGAAATGNGSIGFGNDVVTTNRIATGLARAMWSYQAISKQQALQWLNNPWAFWHPGMRGQGLNLGIKAPAGGAAFNPAWAANANWINGAMTGI